MPPQYVSFASLNSVVSCKPWIFAIIIFGCNRRRISSFDAHSRNFFQNSIHNYIIVRVKCILRDTHSYVPNILSHIILYTYSCRYNSVYIFLYTYSCIHNSVCIFLYAYSCIHNSVYIILDTYFCTHIPVHIFLYTYSCIHKYQLYLLSTCKIISSFFNLI